MMMMMMMITHTSSTQSPHTFLIYMVNDQLQLCICPCSDDVKRQGQQCQYHLQIQIVYPKDVFSHVQTTSNHVERDLERREDVTIHPGPNPLQQILHITMAMRCCNVLEQNDTMLNP